MITAKSPRPRIQPGFRVGKLAVEERTGERKNNYSIWRCRCGCGGEILLDTRCLQRGTVTDCGCETRVKPGQKDITGQRFGMLTAVYPTGEKGEDGSLIWHCRCDCGGEVDAPLHQLTAGYRKSCGCLGHPPLKDYIGKRFGMLVVIAYEGKQAGMHRWRCRCDCGQETVVGQTLLQNGKTKSCGCRKKTVLEENRKLVDGTSVARLEAGKRRTILSNTSGHTGVYQQKKTGKWAAQVTFKGKTYYLGSYTRIEDAIKARRRGEEMHDEFLAWYYENYPEKPEE